MKERSEETKKQTEGTNRRRELRTGIEELKERFEGTNRRTEWGKLKKLVKGTH